MNKTARKIINILIDVLVIFVMIVSALVLILSLTSESSGVPNIFGYAPLSVQSNSMSPTFSEGDLIISKVPDDPLTAKYEVGDVVTFTIRVLNDDGVSQDVLNTHRVVEVVDDQGITYLRTQGDNETTNAEPDEKLVPSTLVLAKWTGNKIGGVGAFLAFIRTQLGFFLCILLPMIIFFVYEAIRVILNVIAYNKAKAAEEAVASVANAELTEEQKQRAIAEYLAQQKKQAEKSEQDSGSEVQTPAPDDATAPEPDTAQAESDEQ